MSIKIGTIGWAGNRPAMTPEEVTGSMGLTYIDFNGKRITADDGLINATITFSDRSASFVKFEYELLNNEDELALIRVNSFGKIEVVYTDYEGNDLT